MGAHERHTVRTKEIDLKTMQSNHNREETLASRGSERHGVQGAPEQERQAKKPNKPARKKQLRKKSIVLEALREEKSC